MQESRGSSILRDAYGAGRRFGVWGVVAAVVIVHLVIAAQSVGPMYLFDEVGYLAGANVIAGDGVDWSLCGSSYSVGYSVALAPLWWLPAQPIVVYQIAAFVSAALGAAVMWPATKLARIFGASPNVALAIAALVTLVPARALMDNYVIAENPLTLLITSAAVMAWRVHERGRVVDHLAFGFALGAAAAVHARALPLVCVAVVWLITRWASRASAPRATLVAIGPAVALSIAGFVAQTAMGAAIFAEDARVDDLIGSVSPSGVASVLVGQAFTQIISWSLLTVLGLVVAAAEARQMLARRGARGLATPWWWLLVGVAVQAAFFVAILAASSDLGTRLDIPLFGRYLDPFVVPLAVLGATALWVTIRRRATVAALVVSAIAIVAYASIVLPRVGADDKWIPFAIPGLAPFLDPQSGDDRGAIALSGAVALAMCIGVFLLRGRKALGLTVAVLIATTATLATDALRVDPFESGVRARTTITGYFNANPEIAATLAADLLPCVDRNKLQFELAGRVPLASSTRDLRRNFAVGPAEWPDGESAGRIRVPLTVWESSAVWSAPATSSG